MISAVMMLSDQITFLFPKWKDASGKRQKYKPDWTLPSQIRV